MRSETQINDNMDEREDSMDGIWYEIMITTKLLLIVFIRYQMKVYSKDSMDRFGDDLTELILSYLTLEDKIRLECVSKQWKRCVFQRQSVIEIDWMWNNLFRISLTTL